MKKNPIRTYSFWLKVVAAALLIPFAFVIFFSETWAEFMVLMMTGLVAGIYAIIRFIPLMKTLSSGKARLVHIGEILIHIAIAVALVYGAIALITKTEEQKNWFVTFVNTNYRFIIAFFLVTRVIAYFWCTVLFNEKTDKSKFWAHILLIVLACVMCSLSNVKAQTIAIVIAVIALLCAAGLIVDGAVGYGRYRKSLVKPEEKPVEDEKSEEISKDAPTDQIIIPVVDEPTDSAIVN
jgi:hypothetical protein